MQGWGYGWVLMYLPGKVQGLRVILFKDYTYRLYPASLVKFHCCSEFIV